MIAENKTLSTLTCSKCQRQIARKRPAWLEKLADKEGWQIGDNRSETLCPKCLKAQNNAYLAFYCLADMFEAASVNDWDMVVFFAGKAREHADAAMLLAEGRG